jgi:hypothetical protein
MWGWCLENWTLPSSIQYIMLCNAQNTKNFCEAKIISKTSIYGIPTACRDGLWCVAKGSPIVRHKVWFYADDLIWCVGFHSRKYAVDRPIIPSIWLVQLATMFMQDEVTSLEEASFFLCEQWRTTPWTLFSVESSNPINCPLDVGSWPKVQNRKTIQRPTTVKLST